MLLTRSPLFPSLKARFIVRLTCVRHAASVHPEPGSNSPQEFHRITNQIDESQVPLTFFPITLQLLKVSRSQVQDSITLVPACQIVLVYRFVIPCFGLKKPTPLGLASAETIPQAIMLLRWWFVVLLRPPALEGLPSQAWYILPQSESFVKCEFYSIHVL